MYIFAGVDMTTRDLIIQRTRLFGFVVRKIKGSLRQPPREGWCKWGRSGEKSQSNAKSYTNLMDDIQTVFVSQLSPAIPLIVAWAGLPTVYIVLTSSASFGVRFVQK